ncbi:MAG: hypothetical protein IPO92_20275 [Saprospiraceae bacterium]|nr:hypothetical protein [Saprospiraceae bacterium]
MVLFIGMAMNSWSYGSHFMGGYWEVEPLGNRQYKVRYIAYSDCSGDNPSISLATNVALQTSCGTVNNMSLRYDNGSEIEVTQNCTGTPYISCATTASGVNQLTYKLKDQGGNDIITPLVAKSFSLYFINHARNSVVNYINYNNEDLGVSLHIF